MRAALRRKKITFISDTGNKGGILVPDEKVFFICELARGNRNRPTRTFTGLIELIGIINIL